MSPSRFRALSRREFVSAITAAPLAWAAARADEAVPASRAFTQAAPPITSAAQLLDVEEFESLARNALPPAHFGYLATGVDADRTVALNHEAFSEYAIRAFRFNDLTHLDSSRKMFGETWPSPLYLSAVSAMRAFHPEAELAVARGAAKHSTPLMLSVGASTSVEEVIKARGAPVWQQLYPTNDWAVTSGVVRRAERAGCTAIVVTVDSRGARNNESLRRAMQIDNRTCTACHPGNSHDMWKRGPMFSGLDVSHITGLAPADQSAAFLARLRALVKTKLILKGVVTAEDAALAVDQGADAIIVSNHGGRNEETLRATIESLPEVIAAVRGRIPVMLDGGVRRGTDMFKALALGASAVGIGRPYAWGLAAFGQAGVEAVIDILNRELSGIMQQAGTATLADITRAHLVRAGS